MPRFNAGNRDEAGFSLTEVLIVVAIGLIITATGLPLMNNVIANMKLRSSMSTVSGLLQNTRTLAVQSNKIKTARYFNRSGAPYSLVYYVKTANDSSAFSSSDPQIEMEAPITPYDTPSGTSAPAPIDSTTLGFSSPRSDDPSFNPSGIPCYYSSGTCTTNNGFIKYFKDNRIGGSGGWAAISVTPAGRVKRWFWTGSAWSE